MNNNLKKISIIIITLFLFSCSSFNQKKEQHILSCKNCIKSQTEDLYLVYENHSFLKFYEGEINKDGLYDGKGTYYYSDGSFLTGLSSRGLIYSGDYFFLENGHLHTISFNNELIDPYSLENYEFKNKTIYKKTYTDFSYNGGLKNLKPNGKGILYYNNLIFEGDFYNSLFFGTIENNFQNKKFRSEKTNNSVVFEYIDGNKKTTFQGVIDGSFLNGHETIYINDKEIISYNGLWELNFDPFSYEKFKFEDFKKNGYFKIEKPNNPEVSTGNFSFDKKNGYFEKFINSKLVSFDYYKDNEILYNIPFSIETDIELINPNECPFNFPSTINIWQPTEIISCVDYIYNINFIDKENKDFLLNMTYNFKTNTLLTLIVYHKDYKYIFSDFKVDNELGTPLYYLEGNASIYQFVDYKYTLINNSYIKL